MVFEENPINVFREKKLRDCSTPRWVIILLKFHFLPVVAILKAYSIRFGTSPMMVESEYLLVAGHLQYQKWCADIDPDTKSQLKQFFFVWIWNIVFLYGKCEEYLTCCCCCNCDSVEIFALSKTFIISNTIRWYWTYW